MGKVLYQVVGLCCLRAMMLAPDLVQGRQAVNWPLNFLQATTTIDKFRTGLAGA